MGKKKKAFVGITLFYIAFLFAPLLSNYTPINSTSASIITAGSLLFMYRFLLNDKIFLWYASYLCVLAFFVCIGKTITIGLGDMSDSRKLLIEAGFTLPTMMIFLILRYYNDAKLYNIVGWSALIVNVFSFLYCVPLIIGNSNILRIYITKGMADLYSNYGIPTYPALHSHVIIIPAILYSIRQNKGRYKIFYIACFALYMYIIFNASITTNLVISLLVVLFALIYRNNIQRTIVSMMMFAFFLTGLHFTGVIESIFDYAISATEGTYSHTKIIGFKEMYLGNNDDVVEERSNLHEISFVSFITSPVWGHNVARSGAKEADTITSENSVIGYHSSLLDRLGGMGLMGGLPFIMVLWLIFKDWKSRMPRGDCQYFYLFGAMAAFILLYEKAVFGQEGWFSLCIYLPCLILANTRINTIRN